MHFRSVLALLRRGRSVVPRLYKRVADKAARLVVGVLVKFARMQVSKMAGLK